MQESFRRPQGGQSTGSGYQRSNGTTYGGHSSQDPDRYFAEAGFQSSWITDGADVKLPEFAEKMGEYMAKNQLTNSKIRSIYGEVKRIQMGGFDKEKSSFYLLKPKVAYAYGREVKNNKGLKLFKIVFDEASESVNNQKTYNNFCNLIEAILAYHRANGGND